MNVVDAVADGIVDHSKLVIAVLLVFSAVVGAGAAQVEESSSLSQFETDSAEAQKLSYIQSNFTAQENTTTIQVIVREDNVLAKGALLDQLRFERTLLANETVNDTLASQRPAGIANVVATAAIRAEQGEALRERAVELQTAQARLNQTGAQLSDALNRTRELQARYDALNRSYQQEEIDRSTYRERAAGIEAELATVRTQSTAPLSEEATTTFVGLFEQTRSLQHRLAELNASYAAGEIDQETYRQRAGEIQQGFQQAYAGIQQVLAPRAQELQEQAAQLQADRAALESAVANGSTPPLADQIEQIESMNASQLDATIQQVLGSGSESGAFALMPTGYEPGSTSANASMVVVTQRTLEDTGQGSATDRITNSQLVVQDLAREELSGRAIAFGAGLVSDEINRSMQDSLQVVGPLAIVFVLLVLTIAYRDLLDILLGILGIVVVLMLTFGFMGYADISFNQLFVAVPVLLIGLSIDYAIHVFMRHREEREADGYGLRGSMARALGGVGIALVLVTATTVIGFLSNLTSPVGPIQEFGVVSAVGIVAALIVFGALIPALKVELDGVLESYGFDRQKRAFGTGGGGFSRVLSGGATVARKAPWVVILLTLLVSAGGAYGAVQVDTSFENKDFIAEEPPEWMDSLPEGMRPGEYSMRSALEYVNDNFLREDSTAEFLVEGGVARPAALDSVARAQDSIAEKGVVVKLSNGEPDITSPLTVMADVAATNETFNATFQAADTDGDGVPDRNVAGVYDALFASAPDEAQQVIYREDGQYEAVRLTTALRGGAGGDAITTQMDSVEGVLSGNGLTATATGTPIVNKIVQDDLLETVVESLLITLAASFVFLMIVYRVSEGSATLGLVTLLPVAFNVAWILGTMFLLGISFNVLTGMITSLTIGLGVAYSIHISERYSLELDRQESAWAAMETAVTGTGGALLGSAATTVGGFGVLVFAILPPLQQFGFITGLTIVYAFFASVFILPSLLVVWTRYLGPSEMLPDSPDAGTATPAAAGGGAAAANGGASTADGATAAVDDATAGSGTASTESPTTPRTSAAGAMPAPAGEGAFASRSVTPRYVEPDGTVTVTVTLPEIAGRVVLEETPPGTATVTSVTPEPVHRAAGDGRVAVAWELDDPTAATVEYTLATGDVAAGEALVFEGEALLPDHVASVSGTDAVPVVEDFVERVLRNRPVTTADLQAAGRQFEAGQLDAGEYERVYHAWLDERAAGGGGRNG
jgi:predicted RND superfamily exporter protein